MVVPDLAQICEIMLIAEGFQASKILARKFVMLYKLCEDLLSKVGRQIFQPCLTDALTAC